MKYLVISFLGSLCPAMLYNLDIKKALWAGLSGSLGWFTFIFFKKITGQVILPTFMGGIVVGLYSETLARIIKTPATLLSVSGIFTLVPGAGTYNTIQYVEQNKLQDALSKGIETIASAGSIALGIMITSAIFRVISGKKC